VDELLHMYVCSMRWLVAAGSAAAQSVLSVMKAVEACNAVWTAMRSSCDLPQLSRSP
jgi:hypothetical protein